MRSECSIAMKQTQLKREFSEFSLYAKKTLILTYAQFCLVLPEHLTYLEALITSVIMTPFFNNFN